MAVLSVKLIPALSCYAYSFLITLFLDLIVNIQQYTNSKSDE